MGYAHKPQCRLLYIADRLGAGAQESQLSHLPQAKDRAPLTSWAMRKRPGADCCTSWANSAPEGLSASYAIYFRRWIEVGYDRKWRCGTFRPLIVSCRP